MLKTDKELATAVKVYEQAIVEAWKVYEKATKSVKKTFLKAVTEDFKIYQEAADEADKALMKVCLYAVMDNRMTHKEAEELLDQAYREGLWKAQQSRPQRKVSHEKGRHLLQSKHR